MSIFELGEKLHSLKKERDTNLLRDKVINAITDKKAHNPEEIIEITKLSENDVDTVLRNLENNGLIACNYGGSKLSCWSFEVLRPLK